MFRLLPSDISKWRRERTPPKSSPTWIQGKWIKDVVEEISATITVDTNVVRNIEIPVKGYMTAPKILKAKVFDFGKV